MAKKAKLILKGGGEYEGVSFGAEKSVAGEVVFATGMVGYPEALTDPSFRGQILVLTYPIIGSYGVPDKSTWESGEIQVAGLVVSNYIDTPSHHDAKITLAEWFKQEGKPLIEVKDTREITEKLRDQGSKLGKIIIRGKNVPFVDPNKRNLVKEVSTKEIYFVGPGDRTVVLIDCGGKKNIVNCLAKRGLRVAVVPWDTDITDLDFGFRAVVISNGPGDPKMAAATIKNVRKILKAEIPTLGICLGNQILALAAGGNTTKMKFGHRSQNQPAVAKALAGRPASDRNTNRAFLTTQNHGFHVNKVPPAFEEWFVNGNDGANEGIRHKKFPVMSVQFHPESTPGPLDTDWIFDYFLKKAGIQNEK